MSWAEVDNRDTRAAGVAHSRRLCAGRRQSRVGALVAGPALGIVLGLVFVSPAAGFTLGVGPTEMCFASTVAATGVIEASMASANEATATAESQITLLATARVPLTFSVASSPDLLTMPDVASGPGVAQSSSSPTVYTFSAGAISSVPRTLYWDVSFSNTALPECAEALFKVITTAARTLTVVPATPEAQQKPQPLRVDIKAAKTLRLIHGSITYGVVCTRACSGKVGYRLYVRGLHGRLVYLPKLSFGPTRFSIEGATGGSAILVRHYRGASLRLLRRMLSRHALLELRIAAKATTGSSKAGGVSKTVLITR